MAHLAAGLLPERAVVRLPAVARAAAGLPRARNRRFGRFSALRAHANPLYRTDSLRMKQKCAELRMSELRPHYSCT
jgi:hypothetical protein